MRCVELDVQQREVWGTGAADSAGAGCVAAGTDQRLSVSRVMAGVAFELRARPARSERPAGVRGQLAQRLDLCWEVGDNRFV